MSNTFTIKLSDSLLTGTVTMKFEEFPLQGMYKLEPQAAIDLSELPCPGFTPNPIRQEFRILLCTLATSF